MAFFFFFSFFFFFCLKKPHRNPYFGRECCKPGCSRNGGKLTRWPYVGTELMSSGDYYVQYSCVQRDTDSSAFQFDRVEMALVLALCHWLKPFTYEGGKKRSTRRKPQTRASEELENVSPNRDSNSVQAQDRPQPPQLSPVFQTPHWPYRAVPLRYWQSDNRTSTAVLPHLRATQKGNLTRPHSRSPQAVRKPEGLAMHCHLHRGDWSFHLTNEKKRLEPVLQHWWQAPSRGKQTC